MRNLNETSHTEFLTAGGGMPRAKGGAPEGLEVRVGEGLGRPMSALIELSSEG